MDKKGKSQADGGNGGETGGGEIFLTAEPVPRFTSEKIRAVIKELRGGKKSAFIREDSARRSFYRECYRLGLNPTCRLVSGEGWLCTIKPSGKPLK